MKEQIYTIKNLCNELNQPRQKVGRRIMLKDIWEKDYKEFVEGNPMILCS